MRVQVAPDGIIACLFDLDGVLTSTAAQHMAAWKQTFDAFLQERKSERFRPFTEGDYLEYVDGRPRADGVRQFLASRSITLPEGSRDDPPTADTVHGIGNRKNEVLLAIIQERGVQPYPGSVRYLEAVRDAGLVVGVVTSSENGASVLDAADLSRFVHARIDGLVISREKLRGKPEPDSFLAGAQALGVAPAEAAVFEDALAGVQAGRAGGFGWVVGVDRTHHADELRAHGADLVVSDLADILAAKPTTF
ncbi:beta-phosphoglucomutase family hydrolase [Saccharopolyspora sp. K220]|uniref:HAD family hydrolase n=1 Tax=Saccharopolyspora soli TaxID=2926618 RepID=UPI001F596CD7|nr:beta-phosphoglucomutase family hydrolase [Saccharopolyspora soli]MCI2422925.1 beta-phosphoglucomutase family hydrolase [Saccharopolyspora soli]